MKPSQVRPMLRLIGVQPRNKKYVPLMLLMLLLLLVHDGGGGGGGGGAEKKLWSVDVCTKQAIQAGIYKKHHHQSELHSTKRGQPPVIFKVILKKTCPASELSGGSTALSKIQGILLGDFLFFKK